MDPERLPERPAWGQRGAGVASGRKEWWEAESEEAGPGSFAHNEEFEFYRGGTGEPREVLERSRGRV